MWDFTIHPPQGSSVFAGTRSFLHSMWDPHQIHPPSGPSVLTGTPLRVYPLQGTASSLAHCPVSGSETICNGPSPPLADIVLFGLPLKVFNTRLLGRGFHTLIQGVSFSSPTDVRSHNPPPFKFQRPRWHSMWNPEHIHPLWGPASLLAHEVFGSETICNSSHNPPPFKFQHPRWHSMWNPEHIHPLWGPASLLAHEVFDSETIYNSSSPLLADIVLFGLSLKIFKTRQLGRGFYTLIKDVSFSSPTDVGFHKNSDEYQS